MNNLYLNLLLAFCLCCTGFAQNGSASEKKVYTTARVSQAAPTIDGIIDDQAWSQVEWGGDFVQWQPNSGESPAEPTKFKILYDDKNLYLAFKCYDKEPEKIVRRMSRRDGFEGDWVEINIDSYFDHLTAFSFTLSASGVISDEAVTNNGNNWDSSWDPIWYAKTAVDQEGWTGEARIPLSQLRFGNKEHHVWGLQLTRRYFRKEERSTWQHVPVDAPGWVHLFGELRGISGIKPQKQLEIAPYALAKMERFEKEEGNPFATGKDEMLDVGVDGKIGITSDLTLDFTINPDFGQVEADPSQVNLSAFEVFFNERRPFFIEGRNILNFRLTQSAWGGSFSRDRLFHSRRIGRSPQYDPDLADNEYIDRPNRTSILGALKLTGKTKKGLSIGIVESVTGKEEATIDHEGDRRKVTVEPLTNYFVGRVQQDFNEGNTQIGAMITSTNRRLDDPSLEFLHKSAYTGGVDFIHNWKERTYYVAGNFSMSRVNGTTEAILNSQTSSERFFQRPDADHVSVDSTRTSLTGTGGMLKFGKGGNGKIQFETGGTWRSPEFALNDIGFSRSSDLINQWVWMGYRPILKPTKTFRSVRINFNQFSDWNFQGTNTRTGGNINAHSQFNNYWRLSMGSTIRGSRISTADLRGGPSIKYPGTGNFWVWFGSDERKKLRVKANPWFFWGNKNFIRGHGFDMDIEFQPINSLSISLSPFYEKSIDKQQYVTTTEFGEGLRYITARIDQNTASVSIRINYSILPNLSLQYYGQPFRSKGTYSEFKRITDPINDSYQERFHTFTANEISFDQQEDEYLVDENSDGSTDYTIFNPDFDFMQYRSNLVLRWEYKPGSTLFLVWNKELTEDPGRDNFSFSETVKDWLDPSATPHNIFLVKFTYRFVL
ncbi:MAG: carbohydrate binding family 9 domain-containing protein [Cyclobacteriaceae bacterium]|nr:carbohydrate binding family 9 domain-containing protein [Cyclobacteriaceae bacterium]